MIKGSEPTDGGNLFLTVDEAQDIKHNYPELKDYIKPFIGGDEFLTVVRDNYQRYCFWFNNVEPSTFIKYGFIRERLEKIRDKRQQSTADRIRKRADYPYLFCQIRQPDSQYLAFPQHTTNERRYIPIGFMNPDVVVGNACYIISGASLLLFGVLMSNVHMSWMRLTCGRLGNGYRYSPAVYNNFPFKDFTSEQEREIEKTAQSILDARKNHSDSSLSALYNELSMPEDLRKAHHANDRAVMRAYGFDIKNMSEANCVAELMKMYSTLNVE